MNPQILGLMEDALARGFEVLVLTNAMQPMQRPRIKAGLLDLNRRFGAAADAAREPRSPRPDPARGRAGGREPGPRRSPAWTGSARNGFRIAIAGRTCWDESEADAGPATRGSSPGRAGASTRQIRPQLVLLPEMDGRHDVPEITTRCWAILHKSPGDMMCASSRMVVKRKGAARPTRGAVHAASPTIRSSTWDRRWPRRARPTGACSSAGAVKLCHPHCSKFCVLGGGSCS